MFSIHSAQNGDADGLIALIGPIFAEYDCVFDVDGELPELRQIASVFARLGGEIWLAKTDGEVVGSIGYVPHDHGLEVRKLYVKRELRRQGIGQSLYQRIEEVAEMRRLRFVDLWSDTRFVDAHRFYEQRGFVRGDTLRELHDQSNTVEYYYRKLLSAAG